MCLSQAFICCCLIVLVWITICSDTHSIEKEISLYLWNDHWLRRREIVRQRHEVLNILFVLCWWWGNSREKSYIYIFFLLNTVEQPVQSWKGANFTLYQLMDASRTIPYTWVSFLKILERHSLLREDSENYFSWNMRPVEIAQSEEEDVHCVGATGRYRQRCADRKLT